LTLSPGGNVAAGGAPPAVRDPGARAAAVEGALRAVLALRDLRAAGGGLGNGRRTAEEEHDDSEDDEDEGDDDDDDDDDSDSDDDGGGGGSGGSEDEETEAAFLARYAEEARRLAGVGPEDPDAGDVEDADTDSELELDGGMHTTKIRITRALHHAPHIHAHTHTHAVIRAHARTHTHTHHAPHAHAHTRTHTHAHFRPNTPCV